MLGVALVKVKVALSVVVNTIFWWSESNHRGQILFSQSDNMDLCCKGFSNWGEGWATSFGVGLGCFCTSTEGVLTSSEERMWSEARVGPSRQEELSRRLGPLLTQFIQKLVCMLGSVMWLCMAAVKAVTSGDVCWTHSLRSPSDGSTKKRSAFTIVFDDI